MRYYTKHWFELMQHQHNDFEIIPDKTYTDEEIDTLYRQKLEKEINYEKEAYNQEPQRLIIDESMNLEDFIIADHDKANKPASLQELQKQLDNEYQQELVEYQSRKPFNLQEAIQEFEDYYQYNLSSLENMYPAWLVESVDSRLLALNYLPETIYQKYQVEIENAIKQFEDINAKARKELDQQMIPEGIEECLDLHDAVLLSLKKKENELIMKVEKDGFNETPYRKVIFKNANILENEVIQHEDFSYFLYHEIYRTDKGYEVHIMFDYLSSLAYLTLECSDIIYNDTY